MSVPARPASHTAVVGPALRAALAAVESALPAGLGSRSPGGLRLRGRAADAAHARQAFRGDSCGCGAFPPLSAPAALLACLAPCFGGGTGMSFRDGWAAYQGEEGEMEENSENNRVVWVQGYSKGLSLNDIYVQYNYVAWAR